ncbi:glycoside hydrolase family protein [Siccibacter turicensis]|uniref:glycoside hydrolase family protein n=1 Tax=Siccibacter turicensis TaxID=357233 RepID=UPI003F57E4A7
MRRMLGRKGDLMRRARVNQQCDDERKRLNACPKVRPPQHVYDALVSIGFNVGAGAICPSTMVSYINRQQ